MKKFNNEIEAHEALLEDGFSSIPGGTKALPLEFQVLIMVSSQITVL